MSEPRTGERRPSGIRVLKRRVLVVDNHADSASRVVTALETIGYHTAVELFGVDARKTITSFAPFAVLMDLHLLDIDAFDLATQIRQEAAAPKLVALTRLTYPFDVRRLRLRGFDAHVPRPLDPHQLRATMTALEGNKPA